LLKYPLHIDKRRSPVGTYQDAVEVSSQKR
jgi:hypothetical protein